MCSVATLLLEGADISSASEVGVMLLFKNSMSSIVQPLFANQTAPERHYHPFLDFVAIYVSGFPGRSMPGERGTRTFSCIALKINN